MEDGDIGVVLFQFETQANKVHFIQQNKRFATHKL